MKRLMITTALIVAAASSAMASISSTDLPATTKADVVAFVPGADLSNLTVAQVAQFNALFANSDMLRAGENPAGAIRAILMQN